MSTATATVRKSPTALEFCRIYNSGNDRAHALQLFKTLGFPDMTKSAMVARATGYTKKGVHLKEFENAKRGRKIDIAEINAELDKNLAEALKPEANQPAAPTAPVTAS